MSGLTDHKSRVNGASQPEGFLQQQWRLFCVAVQFLTRFPVPSFSHFDVRWLSESLRYFPLVGFCIALLQWLLWKGLTWLGLPHALAVAWMMGAGLLMTGGFHEDGWADVCDGLGGTQDRDRALLIMKDSRVGAFGAMGLTWMLLTKWTALSYLTDAGVLLVALVCAHALSRLTAIALIVRMDHVGDTATSKSKPLGNQMTGGQWWVSAALALAVCASVAVAATSVPGLLQGQWDRVALLLGCVVMVCLICGAVGQAWFARRLGGYTGDCLGAVQQISEVGVYSTVLAVAYANRWPAG